MPHQVQILVTKTCQHCQVQKDQDFMHHSGAYYNFAFDNGIIIAQDGSSCHMHGELASILPFGQIPHQDLESVQAEGNSILKWGEEIGLIEPNTKIWNRIVQTCPEYLSALFYAGVPLSAAKLGIVFHFTTYIILDNVHFHDRKTSFPYKGLMCDIDLLLSYLIETDELNLKPIPKTGNIIPKLEAFSKAMREMHVLATASGINPKPFFDSFAKYFRYCTLETCETLFTPSELEYAFTKNHCQGLELTLELAFLIHGLEPSPRLRQDPMFSLLCYLTGLHVGLVNDLLSLKKEVKLSETKNTVLVRAQGKYQSLQQAFDATVEETNAIAGRIIQLKSALEEKFDDDEILRKCTEVAMNYANSHISYYVDSGRYINNDIFYVFCK